MRKLEIPVTMQSAGQNSFWVDNILTGVRKAVARQDYTLRFVKADDLSGVPLGTPVLVVGYVASWLQHTVAVLHDGGYNPIIVNACMLPDMERHCSGVNFELDEGIRQILAYLGFNGKTAVALLGVNENSAGDLMKKAAFIRYAAECRLTAADAFMCNTSLSDCVDSFVDEILNMKYDAVLCANDTVGVYLINTLIKGGFKIPEDLFVIGMGNSNIGQNLDISLTSLEFDYVEMGRQAVRLWQFMRKDDAGLHVSVSLPCRLIIRDSTGNMPLDSRQAVELPETNVDSYYMDSAAQRILNTEAFLQNCDALDREILACVMKCDTYEQMAERFNMSDRAIKYRVSKMIKKLGVSHRDEITEVMRGLHIYGE